MSARAFFLRRGDRKEAFTALSRLHQMKDRRVRQETPKASFSAVIFCADSAETQRQRNEKRCRHDLRDRTARKSEQNTAARLYATGPRPAARAEDITSSGFFQGFPSSSRTPPSLSLSARFFSRYFTMPSTYATERSQFQRQPTENELLHTQAFW